MVRCMPCLPYQSHHLERAVSAWDPTGLVPSPGHLSYSIADLMTGCVSKTDVQETPKKGRTE